ncbi:Ribokinase [subsurface metagenome]
MSRNSILECLNSAGSKCLKILDINLRQQFYSKEIIHKSLQLADVLKINQEELHIIAKLLKIKGKENEMLDTLAGTFRLKIIALTNGADSSILFFAGRISCIETPVVDVADCIGAGDSFTAMLVSGLLKGLPLEEIHRKAVDLSAWVCTKAGATPDYNREIKKILNINNF